MTKGLVFIEIVVGERLLCTVEPAQRIVELLLGLWRVAFLDTALEGIEGGLLCPPGFLSRVASLLDAS